MRYGIFINQVMCMKWGITGKKANAAHVFAILHESSSWADEVVIGGQVFYWTARKAICDELAYLQLKPDTVYRHLKFLEEKGLIDYVKQGKKDCIRITPEGKKWNKIQGKSDTEKLGSKSEPRKYIRKNSEVNPNKLGFKSENDSDLNPTYQSTNRDQNTNDQKTIDPQKKEGDQNQNSVLEISKKNSSPAPQNSDEFEHLDRYLSDQPGQEIHWPAIEKVDAYFRRAKIPLDWSSRRSTRSNIDSIALIANATKARYSLDQPPDVADKIIQLLDSRSDFYRTKQLSTLANNWETIMNESTPATLAKTADKWKY